MKLDKALRRDRKRDKNMIVSNRSIFLITRIQQEKDKRKMASAGYKDALLECSRTHDNNAVANLLVSYVKTHQITKEEAENIWWATRRSPVPKDVRKRLGLDE